jgi:hypothetical protein
MSDNLGICAAICAALPLLPFPPSSSTAHCEVIPGDSGV